jgi:hypothetical protein
MSQRTCDKFDESHQFYIAPSESHCRQFVGRTFSQRLLRQGLGSVQGRSGSLGRCGSGKINEKVIIRWFFEKDGVCSA